MLYILLIPACIFSIIVIANFWYYIFHDRFVSHPALWRITETWTVLIVPVVFLAVFDWGQKNDCCTDSALFSPAHRTGPYVLIALCTMAYFFSSYRRRLFSPIIELVNNSILLLGLVLNILIAFHIHKGELGGLMWSLGNVPIILVFIIVLKKNNELLRDAIQQDIAMPGNIPGLIAFRILQSNWWVRYPALLLLMMPVLLIINLVLFLFGQKPDSLTRAFTDTYKHGFSQLDYLCDNVKCGGHFLCSVAAKGHREITRPVRYGERNGNKIICTRQLLIANAFEELVQKQLPFLHGIIRRNYNRVGNVIHRYYFIFNNRYVADLVYIAMKPLEWFFLLVLYTFDTRPENRISQQYLRRADKMELEEEKRMGQLCKAARSNATSDFTGRRAVVSRYIGPGK